MNENIAAQAGSEANNETAPIKVLSPQAQRALAEAEARRLEIDAKTAMAPKEKGGRGGLDPVRYSDWEIKGLTSDF
ncbi:DUF1674 domain-containing protein [Devosia sp. MC532]|uniref:DUF1674 domain-containing protein n=1 Tax=unclassified Devosia TaxID=196773 RepID=UPI0018F34A4F|nr:MULTISPECIES: DUF1674 domain-containing protein [unclassified Devosia]MBJ7579201.1 DUF1674 domain-containing protein [Devosia sp. MC532]MBK1795588.1 DUF1674 domain-containing protein [Devosia sp. WQ 349K1]